MKTDESNPRDWMLLAKERLESADTLAVQHGASYSVVELLQEAVERYLKGYLVSRGWKLERIHDLTPLVEAAAAFDQRFAAFDELAIPGGPPPESRWRFLPRIPRIFANGKRKIRGHSRNSRLVFITALKGETTQFLLPNNFGSSITPAVI